MRFLYELNNKKLVEALMKVLEKVSYIISSQVNPPFREENKLNITPNPKNL